MKRLTLAFVVVAAMPVLIRNLDAKRPPDPRHDKSPKQIIEGNVQLAGKAIHDLGKRRDGLKKLGDALQRNQDILLGGSAALLADAASLPALINATQDPAARQALQQKLQIVQSLPLGIGEAVVEDADLIADMDSEASALLAKQNAFHKFQNDMLEILGHKPLGDEVDKGDKPPKPVDVPTPSSSDPATRLKENEILLGNIAAAIDSKKNAADSQVKDELGSLLVNLTDLKTSIATELSLLPADDPVFAKKIADLKDLQPIIQDDLDSVSDLQDAATEDSDKLGAASARVKSDLEAIRELKKLVK